MISIKNHGSRPVVMKIHVGPKARVVGPVPDQTIEAGGSVILLPMMDGTKYEDGGNYESDVSFSFEVPR